MFCIEQYLSHTIIFCITYRCSMEQIDFHVCFHGEGTGGNRGSGEKLLDGVALLKSDLKKKIKRQTT